MSKATILVALFIFAFLHALNVSALTAPRRHPNVPRRRGRFRHQLHHPYYKPPQQTITGEDLEYLKAHNDLRMSMHVPPLEWNTTLAAYAQNWAMQRQNDCQYRHHSQGPYGENTFWEQYEEHSPTDVVSSWFQEQVFFDHVRNVCRCPIETDDCQCSHYLAVTWGTTRQVGCYGVTCNYERGRLVVCSYFPAGNYKNRNPLTTASNMSPDIPSDAIPTLGLNIGPLGK
ncbi:unnamed protein product [Ilex paraguariensis]|uniref:SCP domain-containing protein n=1 Tax=Ilex paraguariensis TaxID=185542 RepID=A0ABC8TAE1_9AQUA